NVTGVQTCALPISGCHTISHAARTPSPRPAARLHTVPRTVRFHFRIQAPDVCRQRPGTPRPYDDACGCGNPVRADTGLRSVVLRGGSRGLCVTGRCQPHRRCFHVRHRHAARRWLCVRHTVRHRRRTDCNVRHTPVLHHRGNDRCLPPAVLDGG